MAGTLCYVTLSNIYSGTSRRELILRCCCVPVQAAAAILHAYPPRGGLNLQLSVNKQPVTSLMSAIDRIIAQEYVIDTIHYFDGDNNELARRLGIGERYCMPAQ